MTRVVYREGAEEHLLTAEGHAGYGEPGHDIVCAAVSAVTGALATYMETYREEADYLDIFAEPGNVRVHCVGGAWVARAFEMAFIGLCIAGKNYPQHVEILHIPHWAGDSRERP